MARNNKRKLIDDMADVAGGSDSDERNDTDTDSPTSSHRRFFTDEDYEPSTTCARVAGSSITAEELLYAISAHLEEDVEGEILKRRRLRAANNSAVTVDRARVKDAVDKVGNSNNNTNRTEGGGNGKDVDVSNHSNESAKVHGGGGSATNSKNSGNENGGGRSTVVPTQEQVVVTFTRRDRSQSDLKLNKYWSCKACNFFCDGADGTCAKRCALRHVWEEHWKSSLRVPVLQCESRLPKRFPPPP